MTSVELGPREEIYRVSLAANRLFAGSLETSLEETFSRLLDILVTELKARVALIGRLDWETQSVKILAASGPASDYAKGFAFPHPRMNLRALVPPVTFSGLADPF